MKNEKNYYLGLDIGTNSVGYATCDEQYNLLKFHGEPAWGVTVFDEASLSAERRNFRTARRRLDRRQQRVLLVQELFAKEISKSDPDFFKRIQSAHLFRDETGWDYTLFNDKDYTDKDYHDQYPTIHHLIYELMTSNKPHDARLVYLACAWLVAHRGHFLSNIDKENIDSVKDFTKVYDEFRDYFISNEYSMPWDCDSVVEIGDILKKKLGVTAKSKELVTLLYEGKKPSKEPTEDFPFSRDAIVRLLSGGSVKCKDIFANDEYEDFGSVSLGQEEEKFDELEANIGEDYSLIAALRNLYDWSVLVDVLGDASCISESKIAVYEQHKSDLALLKHIIRKYAPEKYDDVFRTLGKDNYPGYTHHTDEKRDKKWNTVNGEAFNKFVSGIIKNITPDSEDTAAFDDMKARLELHAFMPKQKTTDNRVIPHQLYWYELNALLKNAESYLPFLAQKDENNLTPSQKILSVFLFRIPYFVGPLNKHSDFAWIQRKAEGKIYPWNFEEKVDLDASEEEFIKRMTNTCTYLPGEPVLPKDSLLYHEYTVLNEINNIKINGNNISVELKQRIYNELFMTNKKVTKKKLVDFLVSVGALEKGNTEALTGIDININSNLAPQIAFRRLIDSGTLSINDVERIIERASYAEDKTRLGKWLASNYPHVSEADRKYITGIKLKDFGRLSRNFLTEIYGVVCNDTGEAMSIIEALRNTQNNLMELLSSDLGYIDTIENIKRDYYSEHPITLSDRLDEMYVSNAVKRPIYRTLAILDDVTKAFGAPQKIFVEMTRGARPDQKGQRTKTRKQQILDLYDNCGQDVKVLKAQLEAMGDYADNKLQSDKLFLYYLQLGKCMYTGTALELEKLGTKEYDIDHIYPQAFVKDDSIINNMVLVLSSANGAKGDTYPIVENIRTKMYSFWTMLNKAKLISDEKYHRLTRATAFTEEEKYQFINRQMTETSQSTKAIATLLKERLPETEIVYCKAKLTSDFRQEFDLLKSRTFNDLHHAVDAYLNIVCGNVYNMRFTKRWFNINERYSVKPKTLFTRPVICNGVTVWDGENMLAKVKATAVKNNVHFTKFAFFKKGGLFDQMPVPAAAGLTPLKKGMPTEKYGGYNKAGAMFYIPVGYTIGKKSDTLIMSVELLHGQRFLDDAEFAKEYSFKRLKHILGKDVDSVKFPMGMRPWKVNTVLSLDGFRVCISGISGGGKRLIAQSCIQFSDNKFWQYYLKKLEMLVEKVAKKPNHIYDEKYDNVSVEKNLELYRLYIHKLQNTIYKKRLNNPVETLIKGEEKFSKLSAVEQAKALLNIHQIFSRLASGIDLTSIGGGSNAAETRISVTVSNWKKNYSDVRIIDSSVSGLWQKKSDNLLEIL
jgi:CRISPR-associated endonuclease Csn1